MTLKLTNTLTGKKEEFIPIESGRVKIYSCGPTVYNFAHIGNFRSFLSSDLLTRVLEYLGYEVKKVMNITDVGHLTGDDSADANGEDKISRTAREQQVDPYEIAQKFEDAFREDEKLLRVRSADEYPRATEFIPEQIALTEKLITEGYAYEANGSVYFRTKQFEKYGQLSKNKLEDLVSGARVEINSEKEDPLDFALWKKAEENHLMQWDSPWGRGFPGWHVECSAMSQKLLGFPFDIHTGGEDNVFPHHECEIAQNECSCGGTKSVNYWLHTKHLQVEGKKMSKSVGNFFTIRDLVKEGWNGNEIRFALLGAHYRSTLDFSKKSLEQARASIARIVEARRVAEAAAPAAPSEWADPYREKFIVALSDDLNVAEALAVTFELTNAVLKLSADGKLSPEVASAALDFFDNDFEVIFSCLPEEVVFDNSTQQKIDALLAERVAARAAKNWAETDRIRDELLEEFNVEVRDGPDGQAWSVKH